jgi:CRISPR-associated endonuclease/helicase Cas3
MGMHLSLKEFHSFSFKNLTGHDPYPYQIKTYGALERGESVILRAPTGSGKNEAVFVPFKLSDLRR